MKQTRVQAAAGFRGAAGTKKPEGWLKTQFSPGINSCSPLLRDVHSDRAGDKCVCVYMCQHLCADAEGHIKRSSRVELRSTSSEQHLPPESFIRKSTHV